MAYNKLLAPDAARRSLVHPGRLMARRLARLGLCPPEIGFLRGGGGGSLSEPWMGGECKEGGATDRPKPGVRACDFRYIVIFFVRTGWP